MHVPVDHIISVLFVTVYLVRAAPEKPTSWKSSLFPLLGVTAAAMAMALLLTLLPVPVKDAIPAYLFFTMHAVNILKEYAESEEKGGDFRTWQVPYVYALLLAIAMGTYTILSTWFPSARKKPGFDKYYMDEDEDHDKDDSSPDLD